MADTPSTIERPHRTGFWLGAALLAVLLAVYFQAFHFDFISWDDPLYVTANSRVRGGFTVDNIAWAFRSTKTGNWIPLTWISHMAAWDLLGSGAGGHHAVNVALHALATLLLYGFLRRATGARWTSALAAALFALHPLHVESVAWVSERKDVLSAAFFMAALAAWLRYTSRPTQRLYWLALLLFVCGLLAKPMLVTLPMVLLLLDVWPLRRRGRKTISEKLPFFAVSAIFAAVTFYVQRHAGTVKTLVLYPVPVRIGNAAVSYMVYLVKLIWPARLAVFYPYKPPSMTLALASMAALLAISAVAWRQKEKRPYLTAGWFWYLVMLLPVIGLVQVGDQSHADRYTYLPSIGIFIAAGWWLREWTKGRRIATAVVACAASAAVAVYAAAAWRQVSYWENTGTLFNRALAVTDGNYIAYACLGSDLREKGQIEAAAFDFGQAIRLHPAEYASRINLGLILLNQGHPDEALAQFQEAGRIAPEVVRSHTSMGMALTKLGRAAEALPEYQTAARLDPEDGFAATLLGAALEQQGQKAEGMRYLEEAVRLSPGSALAHYNLSQAYGRAGRLQDAAGEFAEALKIDPGVARGGR